MLNNMPVVKTWPLPVDDIGIWVNHRLPATDNKCAEGPFAGVDSVILQDRSDSVFHSVGGLRLNPP